MILKRTFIACLIVSSIAVSAYAEAVHKHWHTFEGFNEGNDKKIEDCLRSSPNIDVCKKLDLPFDGANWSAGAAQSTAAWASLGKKFYAEALRKHPQQTGLIADSQLAWYEYAKINCEMETQTATYDDDSTEGSHPPYYDSVTYNSCIYGMTVDRVLLLFLQSK
jgi:uncharacterized protein YecT (DUF1311 family)